mmetsp:Transcript_18300/g.51807  ORF Transcript_18300/g.51807 Transcript_18300/m.51807 type:complete len:361 (-) Transcript_18300:528-1610(-)
MGVPQKRLKRRQWKTKATTILGRIPRNLIQTPGKHQTRPRSAWPRKGAAKGHITAQLFAMILLLLRGFESSLQASTIADCGISSGPSSILTDAWTRLSSLCSTFDSSMMFCSSSSSAFAFSAASASSMLWRTALSQLASRSRRWKGMKNLCVTQWVTERRVLWSFSSMPSSRLHMSGQRSWTSALSSADMTGSANPSAASQARNFVSLPVRALISLWRSPSTGLWRTGSRPHRAALQTSMFRIAFSLHGSRRDWRYWPAYSGGMYSGTTGTSKRLMPTFGFTAPSKSMSLHCVWPSSSRNFMTFRGAMSRFTRPSLWRLQTMDTRSHWSFRSSPSGTFRPSVTYHRISSCRVTSPISWTM